MLNLGPSKMAISGLGVACRIQLGIRRPLLYCLHKVRYSASVVNAESIAEPTDVVPRPVHGNGNDNVMPSEWKMLNSKDLGISPSKIAKPTKLVLKGLKKKGYEVFLVGGCVRDLILNRTPKDFDIITSAELKEILRTFPRSEVVGKRFPICHVYVGDTIVEVSSFSTSARKLGGWATVPFRKPQGCDERDYVRWRNCLQRDFTINGLMFDPFAKVIYDYLGGIEDIEKAKVRTVIPANVSFVDDCARILRAIRIAARLGFRFTRETAHFVKEFSGSVLRLDRGRILMEMNYMLAFGSAEASLRLLWKFGLLEILLPIQAAYLVSQGFRRRDKRSNMLFSLFCTLDRLVAPDRPCHSSLWVSILAFHKALIDQPRDPYVIAAFSLAVHSGGSLLEAVDIAKEISQPYDMQFHELLQPQDLDSNDKVIDEIVDLAASVKDALSKMTDEYFVSQAMARYPQAPHSDLVFIPFALSQKVCRIFECVGRGQGRGFETKRGSKINYESLALGHLPEVRHLFARIVFDTVFPPYLNENINSVAAVSA